MADLSGIGAGLTGGLQGLVEAYKIRLAEAQEAAKTRQSGFNAAMSQEGAQERAILALLAKMKPADAPTEREKFAAEEKHRRVMEGKRPGVMTGSEANKLLNKQIFLPDEEVSPGERILAAQQVAREQAPVGAREQYRGLLDADQFLTQMQTKFRELSAKGKTGPVMGRWTRGLAALTSGKREPEVAAYQRLRTGLAGRLKSTAGEAGRITDEDIKRMIGLIGGAESGTEAAETAYADVMSLLRKGKTNIETTYPGIYRQLGMPEPGGGGEDADPMGILGE